ncbi:MAG TPA: NUDIX hydrolase [Candidatus Paceibacterota bacterium]|nr:NUDIX hydrolase [Candidatus Paceibacterota bacterium]
MDDRAQHFVGKIAQKAIVEKDGKILVVRGIGDKVWEFPGGRLHAGEAPIDGIKREIKEELGIVITDIKPLFLGPSFHYKDNAHQVYVAYTCTYDGSALTIDPKELEDMKWVSREELKTLPMFEDDGTVGTIRALLAQIR